MDDGKWMTETATSPTNRYLPHKPQLGRVYWAGEARLFSSFFLTATFVRVTDYGKYKGGQDDWCKQARAPRAVCGLIGASNLTFAINWLVGSNLT